MENITRIYILGKTDAALIPIEDDIIKLETEEADLFFTVSELISFAKKHATEMVFEITAEKD